MRPRWSCLGEGAAREGPSDATRAHLLRSAPLDLRATSPRGLCSASAWPASSSAQAAFRAREKQRLAIFEMNVQRKRLGLPRLEAAGETDQAAQPGWDDRVRPDMLSVLAAVGGLTLSLKPSRKASLSRPVSAGRRIQ